MQQIELRKLIYDKNPLFLEGKPEFIKNIVFFILEKVFYLKEINQFIAINGNKQRFEFIDELFEFLDFSYFVSARDKAKIPSEGRLICISNHPLGALDGLALLRTIGEVRSDVKIVVNDVLTHLDGLKDLFLPVDVFSIKSQKSNLLKIEEHLLNEGAVIIFPAAEVSRLSINGVKDKKWQKGAVRLAKKFNSPVLPMMVDGRNTLLFYALSYIYKGFSTFLLPREMFKKRGENITISIGNPITPNSFNNNIDDIIQTKLLRRHTYNLHSKQKNVFKTEKTIIHPIQKQILKFELAQCKLLGSTKDGKKIYLAQHPTANGLLKEISRLREITFRKVGEGTGNKADIDTFDEIYQHIVLWDDDNLEIVGSYRLGNCKEILKNHGLDKIYNSTLFKLNDGFVHYLNNGIELGRSFVQQKYWGSNALDYLWQGIGAYLSEFPTRYLFGSVSISNTYNEEAKTLIVEYYKKWYKGQSDLMQALNPFKSSEKFLPEVERLLNGKSPEDDMRNLKTALKNYGLSVPTLLRKYCDICEYGGVSFLDFGVDESFSNSVDCMIFVDLDKIKSEFRDRYYNQKSFNKTEILEPSKTIKKLEAVVV